MAITFQNLCIDVPVDYVCIEDFQLEHQMNQHGWATVKILLEDNANQDVVQKFSINDRIKIYTSGKNGSTIFVGVPIKVQMSHIGMFFRLTIQLYSVTILLDLKKKSRSFQNISMTYRELIAGIVKEYSGLVKDLASNGKKLKGPYIQYEETDWEFLLRMSSCVGAVFYSPISAKVPNCVVGIQKENKYNLKDMPHTTRKNIKQYLQEKSYEGKGTEDGAKEYIVRTVEHYQVGDEITFHDVCGIVMSVSANMRRGRMVFCYRIKQEKGIFQLQRYNSRIAGNSIEGKVLEIDKHQLKLHLSIDESQKKDEAFSYPFSTQYTGKNSTGWYAMPEVGQSVNLFVPKNDETAAFITKVNRTDGDNNQKTVDPLTKYFGTKEGREMKLAPEEVTFSAVEEKTFIKLSDNGGVTIQTPDDIKLNGKVFSSTCKSFDITSKEKIVLVASDSSIVVDNVMHIKG